MSSGFRVPSFSAVATFLFISFFAYFTTAGAQIAPTNTATISGTVTDQSGKSVPGAQIILKGPKQASTQTDVHGNFLFIGVPFGEYILSAAKPELGTVTRNVEVQDDITVDIQYESSNSGLKTIASVGASSAARFNILPASVTRVDPMANALKGKTSWRPILEQIPGVSQAGIGSGATNYSSMPNSPLAPVQISIDGALPYETSVSLDDMPLIGGGISVPGGVGSGTNIGLYSLNGFSSADVVRGPGANAPSIIDSIGGSFVLHAPGAVNVNHSEFAR